MPPVNLDYLNTMAAGFNYYKVLGILAIIACAFIIVRLGSAAITRLFSREEDSRLGASKRVRTMAALSISILRYSVYFIALVMILGICGVQTGALLAGAGVVGLAVGFGAKNLVEDVISGFFILFEDQFAVGDHITAVGVSGIVEAVGLRVTRLKDTGGQVHYIPNGKIAQVTNHSRGNLQAVVDIGVAYSADHNQAISVLEQVCLKLSQEYSDLIVTGPEVLGIVALHPDHVLIRISAGAMPLQKAKVEREIMKLSKEAMENAGIKPG
ncbi:MAG: putative MscS family protein YkuT [Pelotomaculum sp. PtaB.Bin013]|uniref:Mechanosensitive ion channel family protein n=1 Tax=Pelotomaculum isophthalicicum JI TaxID=947010 RepID=A0A9X4H521_9FIRM|nr:mechanosensitive ion channel family protein [Pelotomaculum isophthalicicum]MDF9407763.1 mechanosensitive ion channel family protein [Pelotomaculum isophthalicicum JI]OPX92047.1 MAG: putative MscS family protein YkuT [Pelotomaculum sp. PtaB.Bin013]